MKTPKKRDQKGTKAKLLKAALDIFSKEGYDAATTRSIAKKAGVNESLIHRYFESKAGLFVALKQQFREESVARFLSSYEESETLHEEIVKLMNFKMKAARRDKKFFKLSVSRAILDPKVRDDVQSYAKMKPQALIERFERLRKKGQLRKELALDDAIDVIHVLSFAISIMSEAIECLKADEADHLIEIAADVLTRGLLPKK